jgi:hypothetical protein
MVARAAQHKGAARSALLCRTVAIGAGAWSARDVDAITLSYAILFNPAMGNGYSIERMKCNFHSPACHYLR